MSNYPNPFVERTRVKYTSMGGHTLVQIFNPEGQLVNTLVNSELPAGTYETDFENPGLASGIYHLRLQNESLQQVRNMMIVR